MGPSKRHYKDIGGSHGQVHAKAALVNFYMVKGNKLYKNTKAIINVIMAIARRVIYTLYYQ